jgi:hypothetical protein
MNQIQIHIVQPGLREGRRDRLLGSLVAGVARRDLGGEEDLGAGQAGGPDGVCDGLLVAIGAGGVDVAVACAKGVEGYAFGVGGGAGWGRVS